MSVCAAYTRERERKSDEALRNEARAKEHERGMKERERRKKGGGGEDSPRSATYELRSVFFGGNEGRKERGEGVLEKRDEGWLDP